MENCISLSTAGGGKTTKLIERINKLSKNIGSGSERILVISFTNASCDDIYKRSGINAMTLHSFCYSYLPSIHNIEENIDKFTSIFLKDFFYLNQLGFVMVNQLLMSYYIFKQWPDFETVLSDKDNILNQEFKALVKLIDEEKKNHNCLFFPDIIHAFDTKEHIYNISCQYDHICIDEAQDLSQLQLKIIFQIIENIFLEENKSFFIIGDIKQSIYDFQGSSPQTYREFCESIKNICKKRNIPLLIQ